MVSYFINSTDDVRKLVNICEKYKEDIDVIHGRQTIDGKSILGVTSLIGNVVGLEIITDDDNLKNKFKEEFNNGI